VSEEEKRINMIRKIKACDTEKVLEMMRTFYISPAVFTNGSEAIFKQDIAACLSDSPYLEGYVFEEKDTLLGYAMVAKSFSTEFGKPCLWIEDLYLLPEARHHGLGTAFLDFIEQQYPHTDLRLEVEEENTHAVATYKKCGYDILPYMEMKKEVGRN
jgi:GNAT superfamily N-acetyltransferase